MTTVVKKAVAKKKSPVLEDFEVSFTYERSTKGTHVFKEDGDPENHVIGAVYLKKSKIGDSNPAGVKLIVSVY